MTDDTAISLLKQRTIGSSRQVFVRDTDIPPNDPNTTPTSSLYIHIPFCFHKCHYCDFYSIVDRQDRQEAFTDRLICELRAQVSRCELLPIRSIFVGGGTPTLLAPNLWKQLLSELDSLLDLSLIRSGEGEFTVECNPETVTEEIADILAGGGVNRASVGAQSFNPVHLKALERHHDPDNVARALDRLGNAGITRRSVDLIYAIPGQTLEEFDHDLRAALSLPIDHLSAYGLTYEPNTAMTARLRRGEFAPAPEDPEVAMYRHGLSVLRERGFDRYEVSNHSKPGSECRHNLAYWRGDPWLAVGPSASGHMNGWRWKNTPRLDDYLQQSDDGFAPVCDLEPPDARRSLMDRLMTGIRLREGLDASEMLAQAESLGAADRLHSSATYAENAGWLQAADGPRWVLTDEGFLFADRVAGEFIGALIDRG
ncbi:MAG: radical SAM family heme chaperone HemW [Phycisphaerales bacterium]|nr:radical SAM family heme chaperone HemW [Phycisphaerales bacterium]